MQLGVLRPVLQALHAQVIAANPEALLTHRAVTVSLRAAVPKPQLDALDHALQHYEFDSAQELLEALIESAR